MRHSILFERLKGTKPLREREREREKRMGEKKLEA
jgi:hypothetical protein